MKDAASKLSAPTRTRVKICGLTREQDVEAAVEAGADAVGFVLYAKSPRAVSAQRAAELARRLPPFVTPVLLFVNEDATKAIADLAGVAGAAAQFHGDETPEQCWAASGEGRFRYLPRRLLPSDVEPRLPLVELRCDPVPIEPHESTEHVLGRSCRLWLEAHQRGDDEALAGLHQWLAEHEHGYQGKVVYDLRRDFGLDPNEVRKEYQFYFDAYPVKPEVF